MIKKLFSVVLLTIGFAALAVDKPFELKANGSSYTATFKGMPLIVGEGFLPGFAPERTYSKAIGSDLVLNACGKSKNNLHLYCLLHIQQKLQIFFLQLVKVIIVFLLYLA